MKNLIKKRFQESIQVKEATLKGQCDNILSAAQEIIKALQRGNKVIFFGNGGSAADSQHIAAELIGRFQKERKSLPAVALTTDTSILTALGNDYGFDVIFKRQIEGLGQRGDVAVAISTSGNSKNVLEAVLAAKKMGIITLGFTGDGGGRLASLCDVAVTVPSSKTARIQESHICIFHVICELAEDALSKK